MTNTSTPIIPIPNDFEKYPFLVKTLITYTKLNAQGLPERHKKSVVFKLERESAKMPWYVLKNYSVPRYLTETEGPFEVAWNSIYEIKIEKLINRADPGDIDDIPLRVMTLEQLQALCIKKEIVVPIDEFYSVAKAREMVSLRLEDPKGFEKHLREYREGKQHAHPELDSMRKNLASRAVTLDEFAQLDKIAQQTPLKAKKPGKLPQAPSTISTEEEAQLLEDKPVLPSLKEKKEPVRIPARPQTPTPPKAPTIDPFAGV